jgi:hypothetical protein
MMIDPENAVMKKTMILFAIAALATTASAQEVLVNPDFTGASDFIGTKTDLNFSDLDQGWKANNAKHWAYNDTQDRVDYLGDGIDRCFGQLVSGDAGLNNAVISINFYMDGASNTALDFRFDVVGYDGSGAIASGQEMGRLAGFSTHPGETSWSVPSGYTATTVASYEVDNVGSVLDYTSSALVITNDIDLSAYEYFTVRVSFEDGSADQVANDGSYVTSVSIQQAGADLQKGTLIMVK